MRIYYILVHNVFRCQVQYYYCHVINKQCEQINFGKPRTWKLKYCMATQRCWVIWTESHQKKNTFGMSQVEGGPQVMVV